MSIYPKQITLDPKCKKSYYGSLPFVTMSTNKNMKPKKLIFLYKEIVFQIFSFPSYVFFHTIENGKI